MSNKTINTKANKVVTNLNKVIAHELNEVAIKNETKFSKSILDKLNALEIKESAIHENIGLYKNNPNKSKRVQLRTQLEKLINSTFINAKLQKVENLKKDFENLKEWQEQNLISEKFESASFTRSKQTKIDFDFVIEVFKDCKIID